MVKRFIGKHKEIMRPDHREGAEPKAMATYREQGKAVSVSVVKGAEPKAMATYREQGEAVSVSVVKGAEPKAMAT
ncbi:hypothetical protein ASD24_22085 [Paenibacillus sp. Root52]|nr:hypothetical protein ASD24_22085 [Paenibacillus sp. Root52]